MRVQDEMLLYCDELLLRGVRLAVEEPLSLLLPLSFETADPDPLRDDGDPSGERRLYCGFEYLSGLLFRLVSEALLPLCD